MKLRQNVPFAGREALAAEAEAPLAKRLACFTVDDPEVVLLGRETIYRDGGGVTTGYLESGFYELEVATRRVPCALHLGALYDPRMERVKS